MVPASNQAPTAVARILYKEIVEGDLRKFRAESNDADTGGGARDLRFGDYRNIEPIIKDLFPGRQKVKRSRDRIKTIVEVFTGTFYWERNGQVRSSSVQFEPPTSARPQEGRITKVHEQPAFNPSSIIPLKANDKIFLLFVQRNDGQVWPYFVKESSLLIPNAWDPRVAKELLACISKRRAGSTVIIGYRDFTTAKGYCNGR